MRRRRLSRLHVLVASKTSIAVLARLPHGLTIFIVVYGFFFHLMLRLVPATPGRGASSATRVVSPARARADVVSTAVLNALGGPRRADVVRQSQTVLRHVGRQAVDFADAVVGELLGVAGVGTGVDGVGRVAADAGGGVSDGGCLSNCVMTGI